MSFLITMANSETIIFKSKYDNINKAFIDVLSRRYIEFNNSFYMVTAIVRITEGQK